MSSIGLSLQIVAIGIFHFFVCPVRSHQVIYVNRGKVGGQSCPRP